MYFQVVEPVQLSTKELLKYDGSNKALPMYLAIKGTIFDVSKGEMASQVKQACEHSSLLSCFWGRFSHCFAEGMHLAFLQAGNSMDRMGFTHLQEGSVHALLRCFPLTPRTVFLTLMGLTRWSLTTSGIGKRSSTQSTSWLVK